MLFGGSKHTGTILKLITVSKVLSHELKERVLPLCLCALQHRTLKCYNKGIAWNTRQPIKRGSVVLWVFFVPDARSKEQKLDTFDYARTLRTHTAYTFYSYAQHTVL